MTIHELAQRVGMTARNIRAYQSRGLLYPPALKGRVAYYSGAHAARLQLIASLQREGFNLAAIKRLVESPSNYSSIVADRRRRLRDGSADVSPTVPVSEDRIRDLYPGAPSDLTETGLVWREDDGTLVSPTVVVGVARTLLTLGLPIDVVAALQLEAVRHGRALGTKLRSRLVAGEHAAGDVAKVAVQLSATAFEIAFLDAATAAASGEPSDSAETA